MARWLESREGIDPMSYAVLALPAIPPLVLLAYAYAKLRKAKPRTFRSESEWLAFEAGQ